MALDAGAGGINRSGGRLRLAAAAIFKNEGPYILEWLAHHRALGIDRFFIADNDSTDETTATLAALARVGIVEHIPFPSEPGQPPQQAAYQEIVRRYRTEVDWIAFLDADEFLVPAALHRSIPEVMATIDPGPDVGAIAVNWAIYGSASLREADARPVAERFDRRAEQAHPVNRHYKSIVRPIAVEGKIQTPHALPLKPGFRIIHPDGSNVADVRGPKGLSQRILWDPLRINHYVIKSWDEFYYRKRTRGRATRPDKLRDESFFEAHDRNEVLEPMPLWLAMATEDERLRIEALLRNEGAPGTGPETAGRPFSWRTRLSTLLDPGRPQGAVEAVEIQGDIALIRGWALTPRKEAVEGFAVAIGERTVPVASLVKIQRSDVIARFPGASADCGFNLKIAWPDPGGPCVPLTVTARYASNRVFPVPATEATWLLPPPPAPPAARPIVIPDKPSMPPEATAALAKAVTQAACYLEYGSGGSTVLAVDLGVPAIVSVESDRDWLQAVHRKLAARGALDHHHLLHIDIGPTKSLGYPKTEAAWRTFQAYPLAPWQFCTTKDLHPEVVLIDGRFRVACFLATMLFAKAGCRVLFDDYEDRPPYHSVGRFVAPGTRFGRMAEFVVPDTVDRDAAWQALAAAVGDPC